MVLGLLYGSGVVAIVVANLPVVFRWLLALWVMVAGIQAILRHALCLTPGSLIALSRNGSSEWVLVTRGGMRYRAILRGDSFVHPCLLVLSFRLGRWRSRSVVLTAGRLGIQPLRRLYVSLRTQARGWRA